jgi:hypothetical protein
MAVSFDKEGAFVNIISDNFWEKSDEKSSLKPKKLRFDPGN